MMPENFAQILTVQQLHDHLETLDIKESFTPKAGMMPENFAQILTVQQLHDLFAYLETLK